MDAMGPEPSPSDGSTGVSPAEPLLAARVPWRVRLVAWRRSEPGWPLLFSVTLFLSSTLLFAVQPMFAKMVLPRLGGTPATWITCMLFFQSALLAGYAYAHWSTSWLGRRQPLLQGLLLLLAVGVMPVAVPRGWTPQAADSPILWLLGLMVVTVGLPFFVVSSTAPLLQRWFAGTRHHLADDPYFLYRASNVGSVLALLAYPILVEPRLRLADQGRWWVAGYLALVVLTAACALVPRKPPSEAKPWTDTDGTAATSPVALPSLGFARRARWVALAFVPSSFMLAATTYVTTEIAAVPLLWVIPLAIYLLSFIVVFSRRPFLFMGIATQLQLVLALELVFLVLLRATQPVPLVVATILMALFLSALVCHGRLAGDRPPSSRLTEFYLWVALGGALGGVFNAVVAPLVFDSIVEYPLAIVAACLLRPPRPAASRTTRSRELDLLLPVGVGALTVALTVVGVSAGFGSVAARAVAFAVALLACAALSARPVRFGLAIGAVLLAGAVPVGDQKDTLYANRTYFGVLRVERDRAAHLHRLVHGTTLHGAQSTEPARRLEPLTYYHRRGPVGDVFSGLAAPAATAEVGVIGLGIGSLACYGRAGQHWTFYEIDPAVERIARDPRLFTFLRDCPPSAEVVLGDARLSLARASHPTFGLIVVDAFNSDSIPVHLVTRQALALYLDRLGEGGVIMVNITNRYLDMRGVMGDLAGDAGLTALVRDDLHMTAEETPATESGSMWVVMARDRADLAGLAGDPRWKPLPARPGARVWTDDFSNLLDALKR